MKNLQVEIKWAFIFTAVSLLWMVLEKVSGLHDEYIDYHMYLTNLFAIPAIIMMVMALKEKKKKNFDGNMNYLQGLTSGTILSVFISILSPLAQWITTYVITPDYFATAIKRSVELGYFADTAAAEANFNFENYVIQGAIGAVVMGVVTTAIAMMFIRSK